MRIFWALLAVETGIATSATLWAFLFDGLGKWGAFFGALSGILLGLAAFCTCSSGPSKSPSRLDCILLAIFAIISFQAFFWLLYPVQNLLCIWSPYNLGDLALHIQLIRYCALGVPFWPESPILSGSPLVYPIGADLLNAVILLWGGTLQQGLVWMGAIGAALTAFALWQWGRSFALAAFLFAGGAAGFASLIHGQFDFFQENLDWKNLYLSMFVTQRGLLYALPTGVGLLHVWRQKFEGLSQEKTPFWLEAVCYATLPLFNVHAFLFLSFVLASFILFSGETFVRKYAGFLLVVGALPAAAAIWAVTGGFHGGSAFRFLPGWLQGENPWRFWWNNFGILLILWLILLFLPAVHRNSTARCILFAATVTFICCCFFSVSPWAWDNTKFMIWAYLAMMPLLWQFLLRPLPSLLRIGLCVLLFFSGAVALFGALKSPGYTLVALPELHDVEALVSVTPSLSRFATATDYNHPVALCGRKRVAGYEGHLWSHGLPYQAVLQKLNCLMNGDNDWQSLARELNTDFLFWGPREEARYPRSKKPWLNVCPIVAQGPYGTIYDLRYSGIP